MEKKLQEKVTGIMDKVMNESLTRFLQEKIINRKAMFIPILGVATFMLVGYAAADTEAPKIGSQTIEVPYGEKFDVDTVDVTDNRDGRDLIKVDADTNGLDTKQIGEYKVNVTATDSFNNVSTKTINVSVVDKVGPQFEMLGSSEGYVVEVPVTGSADLSSYIKAVDDVDGDVTPFMEADKALDTNTLGTQTISVKATDSSGNETKKTIEFAVSDTQAPTISLKLGENVTVNYGKTIQLSDFVDIKDNYDQNVTRTVEGNVDTKKENSVQTLKITATDHSGNKSEATVNVTVKDTEAPSITLNHQEVNTTVGQTVNCAEYLAGAHDNKDGDLKSKVSIPQVSTARAGTYTATYTVSDAAGNKGTASLTVKVANPVVATPSRGSGGTGSHSSVTVSSRPNYYGTSVVGAAYSRLGCPYVWGAEGPNSFDCSGLVVWCYRKAGKSLPHSSGALSGCGTRVSISNAQPGDILWKPGHVGIYIGGGRYIHAPHTGDVVKISSDVGRFSYAVRP